MGECNLGACVHEKFGRCRFLMGPANFNKSALFSCLLLNKLGKGECSDYKPDNWTKDNNEGDKKAMAILKDSGERKEFESGAVRDLCDGKGRCDLVPLDVVARLFCKDTETDLVLYYINNYIRKGDTGDLLKALRHFRAQHPKWPDDQTMILEVSIQYEDGMQKYGERNWELGMPLHRYINSGTRHYMQFLKGDTDEPHDRAFVWNMLGAIWTHENIPLLIDLPFNEKVTTLYTDDKEIMVSPGRFYAKEKNVNDKNT